MKAASRGESCEFVTTAEGIDVSSLVWKDNKYVTMLSTFAGKAKRFDRKSKQTIEVDCPFMISEYN